MLLDNVLLIFLKYPRLGTVKTRLAKDIGKEKATLLYRLFIEAILTRTKDRNFLRFIFYTPREDKDKIENWIGYDLNIFPQKGIDLGERLSSAFKFTFEKGAKKVIAIGTDSPTIDKNIIQAAFENLKNRQCVLGPTSDGGYYLIGLSIYKQEIFKEIDWGTKKVFEQTKDRLKRSHISYGLLNESFDVDSINDLFILKQSLQEINKIEPGALDPILMALQGIA